MRQLLAAALALGLFLPACSKSPEVAKAAEAIDNSAAEVWKVKAAIRTREAAEAIVNSAAEVWAAKSVAWIVAEVADLAAAFDETYDAGGSIDERLASIDAEAKVWQAKAEAWKAKAEAWEAAEAWQAAKAAIKAREAAEAIVIAIIAFDAKAWFADASNTLMASAANRFGAAIEAEAEAWEAEAEAWEAAADAWEAA